MDSFFTRATRALRSLLDDIAPSAETVARREKLALQRACCGLLMEVAELGTGDRRPKRAAVAVAMKSLFPLPGGDIEALVAAASGRENRYTSYFEPVALVVRLTTVAQRVELVECLWRVAYADGDIDEYEDQIVRKLSELLHVAHADFVLARHRVRSGDAVGSAPYGAAEPSG